MRNRVAFGRKLTFSFFGTGLGGMWKFGATGYRNQGLWMQRSIDDGNIQSLVSHSGWEFRRPECQQKCGQTHEVVEGNILYRKWDKMPFMSRAGRESGYILSMSQTFK